MLTARRFHGWPHDVAGGIRRDLVHAARSLVHARGASLVAIVSIAIAIGPNAAVFSIMERVFLPGGLAGASSDLLGVRTRSAEGFDDLSYDEYQDVARQNRVFSDLVASYRMGGVLAVDGSRELIVSALVDTRYLTLLGVRGQAGRLFETDRDERALDAVPAVISDDLWRRRFSTSADVVGRSVLLNDRAVTIIGIAQPGFRDLNVFSPVDVWLPLEGWLKVDPDTRRTLTRREARAMQVLGLLRPGVTKAEALTDLREISVRLARDYPATSAGRSIVAWSARDDDRRKRFGTTLVALSLAGLVLLVACTNVGTMLLARAEARRRETAVRLAIGANRWQLFRLLVAEALLLSIVASGVGLLFAEWLLWLGSAAKPVTLLPIVFDFQISAPVVAYTAFLAFATTIVCSLMPLWQSTPHDLVTALKGDASVGGGGRLARSRFALLMAAQIVVTQALLCGAALLWRSHQNAASMRPGFDSGKNVLMITMLPAVPSSATGAAAMHYFSLAETLGTLPGVRRASFVDNPPLSGVGDRILLVQPDDQTGAPVPLRVASSTVGLGYFEVMGTRILHGRAFERQDLGERALMINETLARRAFPSLDASDAVGRWLRAGDRTLAVIGVVENGKYGSLREAPAPHAFTLSPEVSAAGTTLLVETIGAPQPIASVARQAIAAAHPQSWIVSVTTLDEHTRLARILDEFASFAAGGMGLLSMLLAAVGLFGLTAFWVQRRTKECGIRMALGAEPRDVAALLQRQAMRPVVAGMALGLVAGLLLGRVLSSVLVGVRAYDPLALGGAVAFVLAVCAVATRIPARRCHTIAVNSVLRQE